MKEYLIPFIIAFFVFGLAFLLLDIGIMSLQGLTLIFHG